MTASPHAGPSGRQMHEIGEVLVAAGALPAEAQAAAELLATADLRGLHAHGSSRTNDLVEALRSGRIAGNPHRVTVHETSSSFVIDAGNGLGAAAAKAGMSAAIAKAKTAGVAFGTVRNSNDFGFAGHYATMALAHDMIGIAMSNAPRDAVPTGGRDVLLGSNPIAFAVPTEHAPPFVLDFSTTTVQRYDVELRAREKRPLGSGWAADANGVATIDPETALKGVLLPLGGAGTVNGGHKGYGLALLVDILCGVLSGGAFGPDLPAAPSAGDGKLSHFFGAIRIDGFRDVAAFKRDMDALVRQHETSEKAPGHARITVAGGLGAEIERSHSALLNVHT